MSVADLEVELARIRDPDRADEVSKARRLTIEEALAFRDCGNVPDEHGRTLRLVLRTNDEPLSERRLRYEPDYHRQPSWRRAGSKPVNVVPLPAEDARAQAVTEAWWEQPDVSDLERQWQATGAVAGLIVPAAYRGFVLKTVATLQRAGIPIGVDTIADSVARWLSPAQVEEIRAALKAANRDTRT